MKECITRDLGIEVFGYLPKDPKLDLPERHLGLVPIYEMPEIKHKFDTLYDYIEKYIDIEKILNVSVIDCSNTFRNTIGEGHDLKRVK
ncbi:cobyrinic acid a,c-diamide synthase [Thermoanaerobacter ethanolicus JW 200]|nr:cobyrinic acid a,c-diamide synthase [Thermoanaerobacter ethanolicus JW 200]